MQRSRYQPYSQRRTFRRPYYRAPPLYRSPTPFRPRAKPFALQGRVPARELKSIDVTDSARDLVAVSALAGAANLATGMTVINGMASGNNFYQRIGNRIQGYSLALECEFSQPQTDASGSTIRLMIVYDRQPNGAYPANYTLLDNNIAGTPTFNSAINMGYRDRFAVLRDEQFTLDPAQALTKHYECYIKRNLEVSFNDTAATISAFTCGSILVCMFFLQLYGTTAPKENGFHARFRYYDT